MFSLLEFSESTSPVNIKTPEVLKTYSHLKGGLVRDILTENNTSIIINLKGKKTAG